MVRTWPSTGDRSGLPIDSAAVGKRDQEHLDMPADVPVVAQPASALDLVATAANAFDFAQNFPRHSQKLPSKTAPNPKCMSVERQKKTAETSRSSRRFSRATEILWPLFQVRCLTGLVG